MKITYKGVKNIIQFILIMTLGSIISMFNIHIRFNRNILREELLIAMKNSNSGYFLMFVYLDILFIFVLIFIYIIIISLEKRKLRREVEFKQSIKGEKN
ncbi:MAG TPA: hypothetical protein VMZ91_14765 [Candidatus Paceibacterota bacterium]|nr:hypothetical protein [Candidatus Paceibacterota bacterium]